MTEKTSHISNLGKIAAMVAATKAIKGFDIPATMMGLTQMAFEDVWTTLVSIDLSTFFSNNSTTTFDVTGMLNGTFTYTGKVSSYMYNYVVESDVKDHLTWTNLIYLQVTMFFVYCILKMTYVYSYVKHSYYGSILKRMYRRKISNMHRSVLMDYNDMSTVLNRLVDKDLFVNDYDLYQLFRHEYDCLPVNNYSLELSCYKDMYIPDLGARHYFNDEELGVSGHIVWTAKNIVINVLESTVHRNEKGEAGTVRQDQQKQTKIPILAVYVNKRVKSYIDDIRAHNRKRDSVIDLYYAHLSAGNTGEKTYLKKFNTYTYTGDWIEYFREHYAATEEANWIDTFFHPCKADIWPKIKKINFQPEAFDKLGQYAQGSWCLYGPPGTGKSTTVVRTAKATGRGIVNINLAGIKSSLELRRIINGTYLEKAQLTSKDNKLSISTNPKYMVIVFDEFDRAMLALKARADIKVKKEQKNHEQMTRVFGGYGGYGGYGHGKKYGKRRLKRVPSAPSLFGDSDDDSEMVVGSGTEIEEVPDVEEVKEEKGEKGEVGVKGEKDEKDEKGEVGVKVKKKVPKLTKEDELKTIINNYTEMDDDDLTVDSLLDIIQGCCENRGALVFAITNKYEKIRDMCPRLFRDGRFKPIYFGYPTRTTVNDITTYYYDKSIMGSDYDFIPDTIRISTARLTNRAVDLAICHEENKEKQFQMYIEHLKWDLENYKLSEKFTAFEKCIDNDMSSEASCEVNEVNEDDIIQ